MRIRCAQSADFGKVAAFYKYVIENTQEWENLHVGYMDNGKATNTRTISSAIGCYK